MESWILISKVTNNRLREEIEFRQSPDMKLLRYYASKWQDAEGHEKQFHPEGGYWQPIEMSGYFANLAECKKAAKQRHSWI